MEGAWMNTDVRKTRGPDLSQTARAPVYRSSKSFPESEEVRKARWIIPSWSEAGGNMGACQHS